MTENSRRTGAHVAVAELAKLHEHGSDTAQVFLGSPRSYAPPTPKDTVHELSRQGMRIYVHAAYLINLASANPTVVADSLDALTATLDAARRCGAAGVIVHAGQAGKGNTVEDGISRWVNALRGVKLPVPLLIENTAGGNAAPGRALADLERLLESVKNTVADPENLGLCIDTAHSHASGQLDLNQAAKLLQDFKGPRLVHVNDSKDEAGSGRDRHETLGKGLINPYEFTRFLKHAAGVDMVVETPGGYPAILDDITYINQHINS